MFQRKKIINIIQAMLIFGLIMVETISAQNIIDETKFKKDFFSKVDPIILIDPLAFVLGASEKGEPYVYQYTDIIKNSGHSCPAVSGGYKITQLALKELYKESLPVRGDIRVTMVGKEDEKVNGPISQVISIITGAASNNGFKGMQGKFSRYNLLVFDSTLTSEDGILAEAIFERMDTGEKVSVKYNASAIPSNPEMGKLTPLIISGKASDKEISKFGDMWQERVRIVLLETPKDAFIIKIIK
jgi:formylmethanofuran dehydrogenase subunit E